MLTMRVVIIEDDDEQRDLLAQLCTRRGMEVTVANSLQTARELVPTLDIDVILTDYDLGDGFSAELFRDGTLDPRRSIVVTGHRPSDLPSTVRILSKPLELEAFFAAVTEVGEGEMRGSGASERASMPPEGVFVQNPEKHQPSVDFQPGGTTTWSFVLYVADEGPASQDARKRIEERLAAHGAKARLEVVNLMNDPERAEADRVVFTPCLVRVAPAPRMVAVGDMRDQAALEQVIGTE